MRGRWQAGETTRAVLHRFAGQLVGGAAPLDPGDIAITNHRSASIRILSRAHAAIAIASKHKASIGIANSRRAQITIRSLL